MYNKCNMQLQPLAPRGSWRISLFFFQHLWSITECATEIKQVQRCNNGQRQEIFSKTNIVVLRIGLRILQILIFITFRGNANCN